MCCGEDRRININLTVGDIWRICQHLKISVDEFFEKYAGVKEFKDPNQGAYPDIGLDIPCKFRKDKRCSIYNARPLNCRIFPYWVLVLVPEERLKDVLKYKCKYDLKKKAKYRKYQSEIAKILLEEAKWLELDKQEVPIEEIKQAIVQNLSRIGMNSKKLERVEKQNRLAKIDRFK